MNAEQKQQELMETTKKMKLFEGPVLKYVPNTDFSKEYKGCKTCDKRPASCNLCHKLNDEVDAILARLTKKSPDNSGL